MFYAISHLFIFSRDLYLKCFNIFMTNCNKSSKLYFEWYYLQDIFSRNNSPSLPRMPSVNLPLATLKFIIWHWPYWVQEINPIQLISKMQDETQLLVCLLKQPRLPALLNVPLRDCLPEPEKRKEYEFISTEKISRQFYESLYKISSRGRFVNWY